MIEHDMQGREFGPERLPTLRDIVAPLFRHRKLVLWTFLSLVAVTILGMLLLAKDYQAEMEILVKHDRVDTAVSPQPNAAVGNPGTVTEAEINSEVALLESRDLLEKVVVSCDLQESQPGGFWGWLFPAVAARGTKEAADNAKNISRAVSTLESRLQVEPVDKTDLIQIKYTSRNPQQAARVLNTLGGFYLEKTAAVHSSPGAFKFFQMESKRYDQQLHLAETQLTDFDRDHSVADPGLEKQIALHELGDFEARFHATQIAIKEADKRSQAMEAQLASTPAQTISQIHTAENPYLLQQLKTTLLNLQLKRSDLLEKFQPNYRPVQVVQKQIDQTLAAIARAEKSPLRDDTTERNPSYEWLQSELTKSTADLAGLHGQAAEIRSVIDQYRRELAGIDVSGAKQQDLVRAVKEAEGNYLLYVQKREQARIGEALDRQRIVNVAIAESATVPALPAHPHWMLTLFLGTLLAGLITVGLAFTVDHFDPSVRTPDELEDTLQMSVLAALPKRENPRYVS